MQKRLPRPLAVVYLLLILSFLSLPSWPDAPKGSTEMLDNIWIETNSTSGLPSDVNNDEPSLPIRDRKWNVSDFQGLKVLKFGDRPYFDRRSADSSPVVVPSHKLLFWTTPKVACTSFKKLFRRLAGFPDWKTKDPHHPRGNHLLYLYDYLPKEADQILTDPTWTRAVFVREPKERLLSAYLDKAVSDSGKHARKFCCHHKPLRKILDCDEPLGNNSIATFQEFAFRVAPRCNDPHWESQKRHIPDHYWNVINFVGHFEIAKTDSERLLRKINAWEEYGATGWPTSGGGMFDANIAQHATDAKTKMQKFYNSSALEQFVEKLYQVDYDFPLFNFSKTKIAPPG